MVEQARERYGDNVVTHGQKESLFTRICKAFINPFTAILFVLAAVSAFTDIWLADPGEEDAVICDYYYNDGYDFRYPAFCAGNEKR